MVLSAVKYGEIYQSGVNIVRESVCDKCFPIVMEEGFKRGLDYHAREYGFPRDEHDARSRVTTGVAMAQLYIRGFDLDALVLKHSDGTCHNPMDDYVR